jgi:UDP-N-acetylmuramate dehydrogenase
MIIRNISLKSYNTFGLDYKADNFISIKSESEAVKVLTENGFLKGQVFVLGGGSNILFTGDYKGTILHPEIGGILIEKQNSDYVIVSSGSGVYWDEFVEWTVNNGFGGVENLSLIPGMVGATPVQNIGAYGVEVKDSIESIRAISLENGSIKEFSNKECRFGYRDSIFKGELKGKYLVTSVIFRLTKNPSLNTAYGSLREEAEKTGPVSLKTIREAVISIRRSKLADPMLIGNAGSFFKNPVIRENQAEDFRLKHPEAPLYNDPSGGIKISAGWLIEKCGWKGKRIGDAGVYDRQALVLVNYGKATGLDILKLSEEIKQSVLNKFGVDLDREVEVI